MDTLRHSASVTLCSGYLPALSNLAIVLLPLHLAHIYSSTFPPTLDGLIATHHAIVYDTHFQLINDCRMARISLRLLSRRNRRSLWVRWKLREEGRKDLMLPRCLRNANDDYAMQLPCGVEHRCGVLV